VYATIRGVNRAPPAAATFEVEYTLLVGAKRSDCIALSPGSFTNETSLATALKQALRAHLVATYAPESFSISDILLFS
jgi:hypothetical protein